MNLSRRAKLDREAPARVAPRNAKPGEPEPVVTAPPAEPVPAPEAVALPPEPEVEAEAPKLPKFVRPPAEKRAAAKPAALPPPSTKSSGKLMSKGMAPARLGPAVGTRKGPATGREPIVNTPKRP